MDACDSTRWKTCTKCKLVKPVTEFTKDKQRSDGLRPSCKACRHVWSVDYYQATKERQSAYAKKWAAENADRKKAAKVEYRARNREKLNAYQVRWKRANPEKVKAAEIARYYKDPVKARQRSASYRAANPDKGLQASAAYRRAHMEKYRAHQQNRRARVRDSGGQLSAGIVAKLKKLQRGLCACCKEPLGDFPHLDHIMPLALGGQNTDDNMQLLRAICNMRKSAKHPIDYMQSKGFLL